MGKIMSTKSMNISYGKFSIRLEGFDDPFPVMQSVTEYFRKIVETDATFGDVNLLENENTLGLVTKALADSDMSLDAEEGGFLIQPTTEFAEANLLSKPSTDDLSIKRVEKRAEQPDASERRRLTLSTPVATEPSQNPFKKYEMVDKAFNENGATSKVLRIIRDQEVGIVAKSTDEDKVAEVKAPGRVEITDADITIQTTKMGFKRFHLSKQADQQTQDDLVIERVAANL